MSGQDDDRTVGGVSNTPRERIAKRLARAGVASRRDAERMIAEGRVRLNGTVLSSPAVTVGDEDVIQVDGAPLPEKEKTRLWRYHKPAGLITAHRDPEGRQTVFAMLPKDMPRVISVGRLDYSSEGLLLLTNDGALARQLELPSTGWARRYRVRIHGQADPEKLNGLSGGIVIDGVRYGPVQAVLDRQQGGNAWLTVTLREGKNREVRRIMEHFGWTVNRLIRVAYGPFQLGSLETGMVEEIPARVLRDQLGLDRPTGQAVKQTDNRNRPPRPQKPGQKPDSKRGSPGQNPGPRDSHERKSRADRRRTP